MPSTDVSHGYVMAFSIEESVVGEAGYVIVYRTEWLVDWHMDSYIILCYYIGVHDWHYGTEMRTNWAISL